MLVIYQLTFQIHSPPFSSPAVTSTDCLRSFFVLLALERQVVEERGGAIYSFCSLSQTLFPQLYDRSSYQPVPLQLSPDCGFSGPTLPLQFPGPVRGSLWWLSLGALPSFVLVIPAHASLFSPLLLFINPLAGVLTDKEGMQEVKNVNMEVPLPLNVPHTYLGKSEQSCYPS